MCSPSGSAGLQELKSPAPWDGPGTLTDPRCVPQFLPQIQQAQNRGVPEAPPFQHTLTVSPEIRLAPRGPGTASAFRRGGLGKP